jgi:hypothetical protein
MTPRGLGDVVLRCAEVGGSSEYDICEGGGYGRAISMSGVIPDDEVLREWGADLPFFRSTI